MLCDWTEKVSLLLDGELPRAEAAAVEAHLGGCAECRAARDEFLSFRRQLSSYRAAVSPDAQRRALERILAPGPGGGSTAGIDRRGKVLAALGLSPLRPAAVAAALALFMAAVGVGLYLNRRSATPGLVHTPAAKPDDAQTADGRALSDIENTADDDERRSQPGVVTVREDRRGGARPLAVVRRRRDGRRVRGALVTAPQAVASRTAPDVLAPQPSGDAAPVRSTRRELSPAGLDASRHAEQAQLLLRAFRNARATDDLAYERERSKRLLYRNIVLRREAASKGDPLVASMLGRLEPVLIDIANLPDSPAPDDVAPIRERIRRKNLVVVLQAGVAKYSRQQAPAF